MNKTILQSYEEYDKFVRDFYPKSLFLCSQHKSLIENLFTIIEITDVFIDSLYENIVSNYFMQIKHQFLLMLYHLPQHNEFLLTSLRRSISETILRMTLVSLDYDIHLVNAMPFYRMQKELKESNDYANNNREFKTACDNLFSFFGKSSQILHNNSVSNKNHLQYITAFNISITHKESQKLITFIKVIERYILLTFSYHNNINDYTLSLANKIHLKKILSTELYITYFDIESPSPTSK